MGNRTCLVSTGAALVLIAASVVSIVGSAAARVGSMGSQPHVGPNLQRSIPSLDGTLFFVADDGTHGRELWKSDGTAAGTMMVKDIWPGPEPTTSVNQPYALTDVDGTLYFLADDGTHGRELWKSDGTSSGTEMVKDFGTDSVGSPTALTDVGGTLFLVADDGTHGRELWKSDGTAAGTVMVKDIWQGPQPPQPYALTDVGGTLFFAAIDAETQELWKSDGTEAGTVMVRDMSSEGQPFMLGDLDGILYFDVLSGSMGHALWRSDGTEAGTIMLRPFPSGHPDGITGVRRTVFFMGSDRSHGGELWRSDGTPPGTVLVKDIRPGRPWSYPEELVNVGGTLYFKASDGDSGLWRSDGTARGTVLVTYYAQIRAVPEALTEFKGLLYFSGHACGRGPQLWRSNGTPRGTIMVKAVGHAGRCGSRLWWLTAGGDTLFFAADDDIHGRELWASDGTRSGTVMLRDIDPRWQGSYPSELLFVLS